MDAKKEEDRDEDELVKQVKPLLEETEKILNQTLGSVKSADPDGRMSNKAKRNVQDHVASPEEQRLAEALKLVNHGLHTILMRTFHALRSYNSGSLHSSSL